mmetsp:Transcript_35463/g.69997  ORF Transcript_35463/g.69997 Transcript_35463/m.69997 type:complete len:84 (-) Transcript_35463:140-391(-)
MNTSRLSINEKTCLCPFEQFMESPRTLIPSLYPPLTTHTLSVCVWLRACLPACVCASVCVCVCVCAAGVIEVPGLRDGQEGIF